MESRSGVIVPEIAEKYDRDPKYVGAFWTRHKDWPPSIGKRGRYLEYDADEVDEVVRRVFLPPPLIIPNEPDAEALVTVAEIAALVKQEPSSIRSLISRDSHWPGAHDDGHGTKLYRWGAVKPRLEARKRRKRL